MTAIMLPRQIAERNGPQIEQAGAGRARLLPLAGGDSPLPDLSRVEVALNWVWERPLSLRSLLPSLPALRWIHSLGAGIDDFVSPELVERRVLVTNSAGVYAPAMVEWILGMLIGTLRSLPAWLAAQREHRWLPVATYSSGELRGKRLGIVGYGGIGRHLAPVCRALGMEVWGCRRTPILPTAEPLDRLLPAADLPALLEACDVVVLTASLNSTTRHLIGAPELARMRPGAILVNVARGGVVDQDALVVALRTGHLRAALLDVATPEPLPHDSPLWDTPGLFLTPHISGTSPEGHQRAIDLFCANLRLYLAGHSEHLGNLVDVRDHL